MKLDVTIAMMGCLLTILTMGVCADDVLLIDELLFEEPFRQEESSTLQSQGPREVVGENTVDRGQAQETRLSKIVEHMELARNQLGRSTEGGRASIAQTAAVDEIDAIIAELAERKSKHSGVKAAKPGDPTSREKRSSSSKAGQNLSEASSAGRDADTSTEIAAASELVKDLWGQLPERQREQILQPLSEEFLPRYASEIEAYFRALADPNRTAKESP